MKKDLILADLSRANTSLIAAVKAKDIGLVKEYRDMGEAAKSLTKKRNMSLEAQNNAAEFTLRAERELGKMIPDIAPHGGDRQSKARSHDATLKDIGINKSQSSRWQQESDISDKKFNEFISEKKAKKEEITQAGLLREVSHQKQEQERKKREKNVFSDTHKGTYSTIVIDPPWPIQKIVRESAPKQDVMNYPTMSLDEISRIDINKYGDKECHLYVWTTQKFLPSAFDMMFLWNFKYIFTMVWHKNGGFQPFGLPQYNCEFILFGKKGSLPFDDTKKFNTCFSAPRQEHSRKPKEFYELVERVSPAPRLDFFSREVHKGFSQLGNQKGEF